MLLLWGHHKKISLLLLRLGFVFRMKYFSATQRLHLFVAAEYGCALSIISHDKWYSVFDSLSFHMNSLQVVAIFFFVAKSKARCILVVSDFELIFCYIYVSVLFFRGFLFHSCLVYHSLLEALAFERQDFLSLQSEGQPNKPQSYPKRVEDKLKLLETPVSYKVNLR